MKVKVHYIDDLSRKSMYNKKAETVKSTFKIKVNNSPVNEYEFDHDGSICFDESYIKQGKKNVLSFHKVEPGEENDASSTIKTNIFRGIIFAIMAFILPVAFMKFKTNKIVFSKVEFEITDNDFFVLKLTPTRFEYFYENEKLPEVSEIYGNIKAEDTQASTEQEQSTVLNDSQTADDGAISNENTVNA